MAQQTDSYLKDKFMAGDQPNQQDFHDLIDSKVSVADNRWEIDIRDFGCVMNDPNNDYASNLWTAIKAAAAVRGTGDWSSWGTVLRIPAGILHVSSVVFDATIYNVTLQGPNTSGSTPSPMPALIKGIDDTKPVFDLGNALTSHVEFNAFGIVGAGGTNLNHRGIVAASASMFRYTKGFLNNFGGSAIRIAAGIDDQFRDLLITNCMRGHADLTTYDGVIYNGSIETWIYDCNVNAPINAVVVDGGNTHLGVTGGGVAGSGFVCAIYSTNALQHWYNSTFAFGNYGAILNAGIGHDIAHCRFEYNQRNGLWTNSNKGRYIGNKLSNNSQEADSGHAHVKVGTGANAPQNVFMGNMIDVNSPYSAYIPSYGFDIQSGGSGPDYIQRNEFIGNVGSGYRLAMYSPSGVSPIVIAPVPAFQQIDLDENGETATPDAQKGDTWFIHLTSAAATFTIAAPLYAVKGKRVTIYIQNQTLGGVTATWNSIFKKVGYVDPATGKRTTARFVYDGSAWLQEGSWSGDFS